LDLSVAPEDTLQGSFSLSASGLRYIGGVEIGSEPRDIDGSFSIFIEDSRRELPRR
jgi:hypothetical protein